MLWNFCYVIPAKLAGMARPADGDQLPLSLHELRNQGIGAIVSLTERPLDPEVVATEGFNYLHLPVRDFTPPTPDQIDSFTEFVTTSNNRDIAVAVHCAAGYGRTGTMLACYLVHIGESAEEAIESVRSIRPGSIETSEQEKCVQQYHKRLAQNDAKGENSMRQNQR